MWPKKRKASSPTVLHSHHVSWTQASLQQEAPKLFLHKSDKSLLMSPCKQSGLFFFLIFIYLASLGLSCRMWDLVPWPGIEPGLPAFIVAVQTLSCVWLFSTPWTPIRQASLSFTISWNLLKLMSIKSMMPTNYLILCPPLFFCPQSFPAWESFMSQLFPSGGQSIGASTSVLPLNIQGGFPVELTGLISLLSKGLSRIFSSITVRKHQFFGT